MAIYPYEIVKVDLASGKESPYRHARLFETVVREWKKIEDDGIYQVLFNGNVVMTKTITKGKVVEK